MSERTAEQIRTEIAAERLRLDDDLDAFQAELRSFVPYLIAGVVALKAELRSLLPFLVAGLLAFALVVVGLFTGFRELRERR
jgi:hypothetical protein